ncbi:MAG: hypothetical protein J5I92_01020 [Thiogranum sp.]|nr:hypothetical protein [Thiogranum sp.]
MTSALVRRIAVILLCVALGGGAWLMWQLQSATHGSQDPVARFLERHWEKPLPAQGMPPAHFNKDEASLAPAACAECHAEQHRDWDTSLHSRTMGNGILWQARALSPSAVAGCLNCHAPLAEQKALLARALNWPDAPATEPPDYVPPDLHRQGLVCAACHVRAHKRYGPPARPGKLPGDAPGLPHDGYQEAVAFSDSRFCATCHQFPEDGTSLNGKLLENTLNEWRASRHAAEGRACQTCHMPGRRHLWRGIHDADMVRQALTTELSVAQAANNRLQVRAEIRNSGAGHYFPTYLVPKVWLRLVAVDAAGDQRIQLAEAVVSRETDVWLSEERSDTRIAPDAVRVLEAGLPAPAEPGWQLELHVDVAPREHYERMFAAVLRDNGAQLDAVTRGMLEAALAEARASRYTLVAQRRALPGAIAN